MVRTTAASSQDLFRPICPRPDLAMGWSELEHSTHCNLFKFLFEPMLYCKCSIEEMRTSILDHTIREEGLELEVESLLYFLGRVRLVTWQTAPPSRIDITCRTI
jgi:hypothetical protein